MTQKYSRRAVGRGKYLPLRLPSPLEIACLTIIAILGMLMGAPGNSRPVIDDHITPSLVGGMAQAKEVVLQSGHVLP